MVGSLVQNRFQYLFRTFQARRQAKRLLRQKFRPLPFTQARVGRRQIADDFGIPGLHQLAAFQCTCRRLVPPYLGVQPPEVALHRIGILLHAIAPILFCC